MTLKAAEIQSLTLKYECVTATHQSRPGTGMKCPPLITATQLLTHLAFTQPKETGVFTIQPSEHNEVLSSTHIHFNLIWHLLFLRKSECIVWGHFFSSLI